MLLELDAGKSGKNIKTTLILARTVHMQDKDNFYRLDLGYVELEKSIFNVSYTVVNEF